METMSKFKKFQEPGEISVGKFRRVRHSASNRIFAKTGRKGLAKDTALEAVNFTATAGGITTGFMAAALPVGAVLGGAAGGAAAFFGAPALAAVLGVVGIINLAVSAYSNRDKAHTTLTPYVWNYIEAKTPKPLDKEAKAAAYSLITDGKSQQKLQDQKFNAAKTAFNKWADKYNKLSIAHDELSKNPNKLNWVKDYILENDSKRVDHLDKGFAKGGAIYEMMRRLNHRANYMQAYLICGKIFQKDDTPLEDFAKTMPEVQKMRDAIQKMSKEIDNHNQAAAKCR